MDSRGTIEILTFSGCDTAQRLIAELSELKNQESFELDITIVPTVAEAEVFGLYGSPTIRVNGVEYQKMRSGNPGFY